MPLDEQRTENTMRDEEAHVKLDRILLILQGNGNPQNGLVTKHELLDQWVTMCESQGTTQKKDIKWFVMALIAIGMGVIAIFK